MTDKSIEQDLVDLYQGEIIGEVLLDKMLSFFDDPNEKYKIGVLLQLETETKARLRPALMQLGLDIAESEDTRRTALEAAAAMQGLSWHETMSALGDLVKPYVERYKEIAASAPAEFRSLAESMVEHEESLHAFTQIELSNDNSHSMNRIIAQLAHKPPSRQTASL